MDLPLPTGPSCQEWAGLGPPLGGTVPETGAGGTLHEAGIRIQAPGTFSIVPSNYARKTQTWG